MRRAGRRRLSFSDARVEDAAEVAALRTAAAEALTRRFGYGHWSSGVTERGVRSSMRHSRVILGRSGRSLLTVLRLATKRPWAIDVAYFTPCKRPIYLTDMAVLPTYQRQGLGRQALRAACRAAREWPGDALRLDTYDAEAGAGAFYAKCGFQERGRVTYRGTPHVYYELVLR